MTDTTTIRRNELTLGPMDPDNTSELTKRVGVHNRAKQLLIRHGANFPQKLTVALSQPVDKERSDALDLEEVESALRSLSGRRAFFKADDTLEAAAVRGTGKDRVVAVVFRKPDVLDQETGRVAEGSGRAAQGVIAYDGLERSQAAYEEQEEARKAATPQGALAAAILASRGPENPAEPDAAITERLDKLEADLKAAQDEKRAAEQRAQEEAEKAAALADPEPIEGYAALGAKKRVELLREGGIGEYGRAGLERVRAWEEAHDGYATVLDAIEDLLAAHPDADTPPAA
jgi:hypothetical protein